MALAINFRSHIVSAVVMLPSYIGMGLLLGTLEPLVWLLAVLPALLVVGLVYRVLVLRAADQRRLPVVRAVGLFAAQALLWWGAFSGLMVGVAS